jgi:hypothetical protein
LVTHVLRVDWLSETFIFQVMKALGLVLILISSLVQGAEPKEALSKNLAPLEPFINKTWKGHFSSSTPEKPLVDVARWERALNGRAVRILHSVNDGKYGGESIVMWNQKTGKIEFHYFTTAGFRTEGTLTVESNKLVTTEQVVGSTEGVTEVRATTELLPDGKMRVRSRHLKNGEWVEARNMLYEAAPAAQVVFK